MTTTLDANVLLYAANADDPRNERANEVLADLAAGPAALYLFWPVAMAFMRIATRQGLFPNPLSPASARSMLDELLRREHVLAPGEDDLFWEAFQELAEEQPLRGDLVSDAHIVALMRRHGVRTIITHDRDFLRFEGIKVLDPFT